MSEEIRWSGSEELRHLLVPIEALQLDPQNSRRHPARNLEAIRASLDRSGQQTPIVVGKLSGVVLRGNGTLLALRSGDEPWTHVAAVVADLGSAAKERQYALADNRSGELAEWDFEQLAGEFQGLLKEGVDLKSLGWESWEVEPLLTANWNPPDKKLSGNIDAGSHTVNFTLEQWEVIGEAVERIRVRVSPEQMGVAEALRLICEEWMR